MMSGTIFDNLHFICHMFHESPASRLESLGVAGILYSCGFERPTYREFGRLFFIGSLTSVDMGYRKGANYL